MDFSALNPRSTNNLNLAARNNDVKSLQKQLVRGRNPNCTDNRGWTALHEAAANDAVDALEFLLQYPKTTTLAETFEGQTALFLACRNKASLKVINLLLEHVENIAEYTSHENVSPLHLVCSQGRADACEALIKGGSILDLQDFDGDTPMHDAVRGKHPHIVAILLHAGADPGLQNSFGLTPFLLACFKDTYECILELFPFVADINECANEGNTGLILAAQRGNLGITRFLLEHDANPNIHNNEGALPLYLALIQGHSKVFKMLLPVTDDNEINKNIINYACKPLYFSMDIIITLLESDLDPEFFNKCDKFHITLEEIFGFRPRYRVNPPLCSILNVIDYIYKSSKDLCATLLFLFLTKGVAVNPLYEDECPPLVYLHFCDHHSCYYQVIEILISQGCNVDYTTIPRDSKLQYPDAIIASITSGGRTLPMLLTYSFKVDPEDILHKLIEYNMIGQRISPEIFKRILLMSCLSVKALEEASKQLTPYLQDANIECSTELLEMLKPQVPSLAHCCRRVVRKKLRQNIRTTQDFCNVLRRLPIPITLKSFLRFL